MIKKIITSIAIMLVSNYAFSQTTCFIKYSYDNAGNRIKREFVCEPDVIADEPESSTTGSTTSPGDPGTASRIAQQTNGSIDAQKYSIVYPNPNKGEFWIELKNIPTHANIALYKIYVLNASGQTVLETNTTTLKTYIDLKEMQPGNYFIVVYDGEKNQTHKINIVK